MNEPFLYLLSTLLDLISFGAALLAVAWLIRLLGPREVAKRPKRTLGIGSGSPDRGTG